VESSTGAAGCLEDVLILEDEPVIAELLREVLESGGLRVRVVHTVADAVAEVRTREFRVGVSDLLLPDRTGLDFVREAQAICPSLRVVLISAYLEPEIRAEVEREPAIAAVLLKPLDVFEVRRVVQNLLGAEGARGATP